MANALIQGLPQEAPQQGGNGNALMPAQATPGTMGAPAGQPPPQVTHQMAVAALRHFSAISREFEALLQDPDLGKADLKSKIIDGTTKLVAQRIISAPQAVMQLGAVPSDPTAQRKWVQQNFNQTMVAMNAVLDHHAASEPGTGNLPYELARSQSKPDAHMDDMRSLGERYKGKPS